MVREAAGSVRARDYLRQCCKEDPLFYFRAFCWTLDPRRKEGHRVVPFIPWGGQDAAILSIIQNGIDRGRDVVIQKSRDEGATWINLGTLEHRWHFNEDESFLCISRTEDLVDKSGDPDALFYKIDLIHRYQPNWLMPKGYDPARHRRKFTFENPEQGCAINGAATVEAAGVGGRRKAMLIDEFSLIEEAWQILLGTADVTDCRIFNFTPRGTGNAAYEVAMDDHKLQIRLHWSGNPRKNRHMYQWDSAQQRFKYFAWDDDELRLVEVTPHQFDEADDDHINYDTPRKFEPIADGKLRSPEYDRQERRRGKAHMAINWDIDYGGSEDNFFETDLLTELATETCMPPAWEGDFDVDMGTGEVIGLRKVENGPLRLWFMPRRNGTFPASADGFGCGNDLSWGRGATPSCSSFLDAFSGEKVAEYVRADEEINAFAVKVHGLCQLFKSEGGDPALICWEKIGPGEHFGNRIFELGYSRIYYHTAAKPGSEQQRRKNAGWNPTPANEYTLLSEYQMALRLRQFINRSAPAIGECSRFMNTKNGLKYVAAAGHRAQLIGSEDASGARENHGDRTKADALALLAVKTLKGGTWRAHNPTPDPPPEQVFGTFAWRMAQHRQKQSEEAEVAEW